MESQLSLSLCGFIMAWLVSLTWNLNKVELEVPSFLPVNLDQSLRRNQFNQLEINGNHFILHSTPSLRPQSGDPEFTQRDTGLCRATAGCRRRPASE